MLVADLDSKDVGANLFAMTAALGEPWMVVLSGGTVAENNQQKKHVYYRVAGDVPKVDFPALKQLRLEVAERSGADLKVGRNPGQIWRIPDSIWRKNASAPSLCRLHFVSASSARFAVEFSELAQRVSVGDPFAQFAIIPGLHANHLRSARVGL